MAKKKLTTEEKIKKYKRNKKLSIAVKIMAGVIAAALMVPIFYYGYYFVVFSLMPANSYNPDKNVGAGYSRPLHMIPDYDAHNEYILAYYIGDRWNVVDDSEMIKKNRDNFTIYKSDDEWHKGTHLQLILVQNGYMMNKVPLSTFTLIDDRCFSKCTKVMTMEEFEAYCQEKDLQSMYIF